jgi:hypothetical protein
MSVIQEGNIKHNYQAEVLKEEFLGIIELLYDLYYEKMNPEKPFFYSGEQVKIPYEAMKRGYKFVLSGSTEAANKYIDRREKEDLLNMLGQDPYINPIKPREEILKSYGVTDLSEWINPQVKMLMDTATQNPEIMQVVQEYMQQKMMVQEAVGGGQGGPQKPGGQKPGGSVVPMRGGAGGPNGPAQPGRV